MTDKELYEQYKNSMFSQLISFKEYKEHTVNIEVNYKKNEDK